jgi:hypothetical protein
MFTIRAGQCSSVSFEVWCVCRACLGDAEKGRDLNGVCEAGRVMTEARRSTVLRRVYDAALERVVNEDERPECLATNQLQVR